MEVIEPAASQLDEWMTRYVPDRDILFLSGEDFHVFKRFLGNVLIFPRTEFMNHSFYNDVQLASSYEYWNISSEAELIIAAPPGWYSKLPREIQLSLNEIQVRMQRGLILNLPQVKRHEFPVQYIVEDSQGLYMVLHCDMWKSLDREKKHGLLKETAREWDTWVCEEIPETAPDHLRKYANSFPVRAGSNCLASSLYAASGDEWILHEWVHQKTFLNGITLAGFSVKKQGMPEPGDIITWENDKGVIQHASFHIGDLLFFNKNGQTFFNPWKIVHLSVLQEEWGHLKLKIYSRG
ncbi:hypothetical protein V1498_08830 [Peribacillus sp. SCS-26]|uniref:hypothetical protein n=1 Tax=Paraperibacillus marinus TaxID=3115295 RepID=UPI0039060E82